MIVIEGCDGIGKTRAAELLCREQPLFSYCHMGPPDDYEAFDHVLWYVDNYARNRVWDRYHLGEWVYGNALRYSKHGTEEQRRYVADTLHRLGVFVVVMYASEDDWLSGSEPDKIFSHERILKANDTFEALSRTYLCDEAYDVCEHGYPQESTVRGWAAKWAEKQRT